MPAIPRTSSARAAIPAEPEERRRWRNLVRARAGRDRQGCRDNPIGLTRHEHGDLHLPIAWKRQLRALSLIATGWGTDQWYVDLPGLPLGQIEAEGGVGHRRIAQVRFVPAAQLEPVVVWTDSAGSDDQGAELAAAFKRDAHASRLLLHHLPRRWCPDEHADDAEEHNDDNRFRDQCGHEVGAPALDPLLRLRAAQLASDDGEIECAKQEQGHDQEQLQNKRLSVRGSGQGRDVADLKPCGVETGQPHHAPGDAMPAARSAGIARPRTTRRPAAVRSRTVGVSVTTRKRSPPAQSEAPRRCT